MDQKRISEYLHSLEEEKDALLSEMRQYASEHDVPIVRMETESFLRTVCVMKKPERVLEIGTAIAYSTLVLARESGHVTTIENYAKRIECAEKNIERSGLSRKITLIAEDAGKALKELSEQGEKYDLVFLDAAKGQYLQWLPDILSVMKNGAVLVADNVLQDGTVAESRFTCERRDRTTHQRMREFLYTIKHQPELVSSVIPVGDGVSVSVKQELTENRE